MKLAYISTYDAKNVKNWSGTGYGGVICWEHNFYSASA